MTIVPWREQWKDWANPYPIAKYTTTALALVVYLVITLTIPEVGVYQVPWFIAGVATAILATIVAFVFSSFEELRRHELIIPGFSFLSAAMLRFGTVPDNIPVIFLTVGPMLWFAGMPGARHVAYAAMGCFFALAVPVLLEDHSNLAVELPVALFATLVLTLMAFVFNRYSHGLRQQGQELSELADHRDDLLQDSIKYSQELEKSEFERGSAERMLRGVWEAVTEQAVVGTDLRGRVDAWNPGAEKMLGWQSSAAQFSLEVVDLHLRSELEERARLVQVEDTVDGVDPGFAALIESARLGHPDVSDWTYLRADGSQFPVQLSITRRLGVSGETVGYLFVANDMTQLREVAKLKDEFVGLISHELRTPLSSILGYLELMRDEDEAGLSENQLQYLGVAERNAHRLLRLVGDLLFTAQVESGEFQLDKQTIDFAPIVHASIESVRPVAIAAGIHIVGTIAEGVFVAADAVRLGQSIDNLVSNAIKFTPRGGTVTVSLEKVGKDGVVAVRDTGMGIAASELDKLFSRFFRATTATKNAVPGVGLGLTITKAIVHAHGGELDVESEEGIGTCFSITLPLVAKTGSAGASSASQASELG